MQQNTGISRHVFKLKLLLSENGKLMKQAFIMLDEMSFYFIFSFELTALLSTDKPQLIPLCLFC